jgi:hypothetical protein
MPDDTGRLIDGLPSLSPGTKANIQILTITRIEKAAKAAQRKEFMTIYRHAGSRGEQRITAFLPVPIKSPPIESILHRQGGWTACYFLALPVITARRYGKHIWILQVIKQRLKEGITYLDIIIEYDHNIMINTFNIFIVREKVIIFGSYHALNIRMMIVNPFDIVIRAEIVQHNNICLVCYVGASDFKRWQQIL